MNKYLTGAFAFALLLSTSFSFTSCKDEDEVTQTPEQVETKIEAYVSGRVMEMGKPLADVTVAAGKITSTTDSEGNYTLAIGSAGDVTVTASKDGYVAASSQVTVAESEVLSLDFELTQQNESVTLSPDAELALEEKRDEFTTLFFQPQSVTAATEVSITEYITRAEKDNMGALSVIYCTPDGQQFEQPVKIQVVRNTSSDLYFANMKHYVEENGTWKVESDMTVDPETGDYVGELDHFSNHAFGVEAQWGAKTATTEDGASQEFDNRGKLDAVKVPLTVESKNGWEVDGDLASIIRTALSGVSEADATELASELNRMIRNAKGCESSVSTQLVKLNEISISGDTKATVAVQHKISTSSMTVSVMFKGQPVSISVPVKVYNGVSMKVSYEYGSLTPEHSGGNIG